MVSKKVPKEYEQRCKDLIHLLHEIWTQQQITFKDLKPKMLETVGAVYIIGLLETDEILYVGRTKDLKRRLYTNHLMGNQSTARLKKYLTKDMLLEEFAKDIGKKFPNVDDPAQYKAAYALSKEFLREKCYFKFMKQDESRMRGLLEAGLTYAFDTRFIEEEH